jgi:hypothetical protein
MEPRAAHRKSEADIFDFRKPTTSAVMPPLTPPVTKADTIELISSPDVAAAPPIPSTAFRTCPMTPPPNAPATELPNGPRFVSLERFPAALCQAHR